jgi:tRNA(Arg) A34 adenosine deaminase TadA
VRPLWVAALENETADLRAGDYGDIERRRSERRLAWLTAHGHGPHEGDPLPAIPVSPREAFELFFFAYMGRIPEEFPVAEETPDRITWLSDDPCPTLSACSTLGLDTREVCRAVSERPVQTFLSRLDPRLRFMRDYTTIRPHAAHCREQIVRVDVEGAMREAIAEARVAKAEGNKGYGAVVLMGGDILAKAHDTGITGGDPSLHAEHTAILEAIRHQGAPDLTGALLISTCEPCPMCTGLAVWSGVTTIMYGSSIADTAAMGRSRIQVSVKEIADRSPRVLDVVGGLLRAECDALYDY